MKLKLRYKGGPGSGHRGHRGRPGKRGGALPDNASVMRIPDGVSVDEAYDYAKFILHHESGVELPKRLEKIDATIGGVMHDGETLGEWAAETTDKITIDRLIKDSNGILTEEDRSILQEIAVISSPVKGYPGYSLQYGIVIDDDVLNVSDADNLTEWGIEKYGIRPAFLPSVGRWELDNGKFTIHIAKTSPEYGISHRDVFWHEFGHTLSDYVVDHYVGEQLPTESSGEHMDRFAAYMSNRQYRNVVEKQHDTVIIAFDFVNEYELVVAQQEFAYLGKPSVPMHMTLLFLGDVDKVDIEDVKSKVAEFAKQMAPISGVVNGIAKFSNEEDALVVLVDSVELPGFRQELRNMFPDVEQNHGFTPHITLVYGEDLKVPYFKPNIHLTIDKIYVYVGDDKFAYDLEGITVFKGGPGSGHFGHSGRPGQVGGSTSVTSTPEFKRWFGNSKVVDADGNPLIVYKGMLPYTFDGIEKVSIDSPDVLPSFDSDPGIEYAGFFGDKSTANNFAEGIGEAAVYPVYLSIQKPYIVDAQGNFAAGHFQFGKTGRPFRDAMRSGDYDGAIILNTVDEGTIYIALKPEQIKSAFNRGTFDPDDTDITKEYALKQLPIDDDSKANLIDIRKELFNEEVDTLAESMYTGEISIGQWEESMKKLIRELHSSVAAIGKGGWDQMTWSDWGRLGPEMQKQYKYLHGFAEKIATDRDTISIDAIKARAHMYANAAGHSAYMIEAGQVLTDKLPWMPKDGSTKCFFMSDKVRVYTKEHGYVRLASVNVGDYVLSHNGKFRRVVDITNINVIDAKSIELHIRCGKRLMKFVTTADHLFLSESGDWIRADQLMIDSKIYRIGKKCKYIGCNNIVQISSDGEDHYCSFSCASKGEKKYIAAHLKAKELIANGDFVLQKLHKDPKWKKYFASIRKSSMRKIHEHSFGKSYAELYGEEKSSSIKDKISKSRKGKTFEEMYGEESARRCKIAMHNRMLGNKHAAGKHNYGTFEEKYGPERALEIKKKLSVATKQLWKKSYDAMRSAIISGIIAHPYVGKPTKPELAMKDILDSIDIQYLQQVWLLGKYRVDFLLPKHKCVVEVDGEYWHSGEHKEILDAKRDADIVNAGYDVIRYWASDVTNKSNGVASQLRRLLANHADEYVQVADAVIEDVIHSTRSGNVRCLVVEEDESFVVTGGIVSHNCLVNCKCEWQLEIVDRIGDFNLVQATWKLNPAEHCTDCLKRDGYVHMLKVYRDIIIPKSIGGY